LISWRNSSITDFEKMISKEFKGREITPVGQLVDFGYEESIKGWEQGFHFVRENQAEWILNVLSTVALRKDEVLVVMSASMEIKGKSSDTSNLFFQTFKRDDEDTWQLVRSYIEAGISNAVLKTFRWETLHL